MTEDTPNPSDGAANEVLSLDTEGLQPAMESDPNWAENFSRLSSPSLNDLKLGTGLRVYDAFVMDCAGAVVGEAKLRSIAVEPKGRNLVVDISQGTEALSLSTQEQPNRFRIDTNRVGTESVLYLRISENETLQFPIDPFRKRQKQFSAYIQQNREPRPGYIRDQSCWRMVLRETKN